MLYKLQGGLHILTHLAHFVVFNESIHVFIQNFLLLFSAGLPKAARVSHIKAVMCMSFLRLCGATASDNIYVTLPLYHMSASLLGVGGCIELGRE